MKQLFFKSILLLLSFLYWNTISAQIIDGVRYSFNDNQGTAYVIEYNTNSSFNRNFYKGSITIPPTVTYNGNIYSVTGIGGGAFHDCSGMTSITIPNSVTTIGNRAFENCSGLTSITIPNSVTNIGEVAFYGCASLTSVNIPYGVTSIGSSTFSKCSSLTSVTIPNSVISIEGYAFENCSNLTEVTIPNSVTSIKTYAFRYCSNLKNVTINSNDVLSKSYTITSSLRDVFGTQVQIFKLGEGVTSIGRYAFYGFGVLTSINIPNSVTSIAEEAFDNCPALASIDIPSSVTSIGRRAFMRCSGLTSITIPNSVTSIGNAAFYGCSSLTSLTIPNYLTSIGDSTFYECVGLTSVTIPNSVSSIRSKAFYGCSSLTSVTANMTNPFTFGTSAFSGIGSTCKLFVPLGKRDAYINKGWNTSVFKGGVYAGGDLNETFTYTYKGKTLTYIVTDATNRYVQVMKCNTSVLGSVEIPSSITYFGNTFSVTSIGSSAFNGCSYISSITIPNSVTSIGSSAFQNCNSLTSVTANMANPFAFGTDAFTNINSTCSLYVPSGKRDAYINKGWDTSVFKGGVYAGGDLNETFTYTYNGKTLTYIVTDATNRYVQVKSCNTTETGSVEIPSSITYFGNSFTVTSIGNRAFNNCTGLITIIIPNSVATISNGAFSYCSSLNSITIPYGVTSIGTSAFYGCSSLTSIEIPNSVTDLGTMAFQECSGLNSVTLSNSLTFIGLQLFLGCSSLTSVTIPNSVTSIGVRAFKGCTSLTSVTIPHSVTSIGGSAFSGCSGLTSVTIGNSVTSIGGDAFYGCSSLSAVYINSPDAWLGISFGNRTANPLYYAHRLYMYITIGSGYDDIKFEIMTFTIPESVTTIGNYVFSGYSGLLSLTIPSSVTSIGEFAFYGCSGLTSIEIPSSVTAIGSSAFSECSGLSSVTANMANPFAFGTDAFTGIGSTCSLFVPSGKRDSYINNGWDTSVFKGGVYAGGDLNETFTYTYKGQILTYIVTDATNRYVQVKSCDTSVTGSVEIPASITYLGNTFSVTSIGDGAFSKCSGLNSISIPNNVKSIGQSAFSGCIGLTSISIPNGVTNINNLTFYGCSNLTSVNIPNNVSRIGEAAFVNCSSLTSITIPKSVISIEGIAFEGCSSLESIVVASGNTVYDSRNNCNAIIETATNTLLLGCKNTTIPNSVTSIGNYAFSGCSGLISISIPNSVTSIEYSAFKSCKCTIFCNSLIPPTAYDNTFNENMIAIVPNGSVSKYKQATGWKKMTIQSIPRLYQSAVSTQSTITLCTSNLVSNVKAMLNGVTYYSQNDSIKITGLEPYTSYTISLSGVYENLQWDDQISVTTNNISLDIQLVKRTNVTLRLKGVYDLDDAIIASSGFEGYEGQNEIYIKDLVPGRTYYYTYYVVTPSGKRLSTTESFQTMPITLNIGTTTNSSSAQLTGSYSVIDATITECGFDGYPKQNPIKITGLDPNKSYSQTFYVVTKEGGRFSKSVTYTTKSLTLTTSQPKVISAGNVIVAAKSNLDDDETNVGFEWRRTDWTDEFASNTGNAYLYNGTMEGYIRSLNTEKLFKYRPYYTSDAGNTYYGEWVGIDPTNTSYFEPTVHTYANVSVNGNSAEVKGYVQRGTDNVVSKGFAYWEQSQGVKSREAMEAPSMISSLPSNAKTIEVSGSQQVMTAFISGLEYETTYCYVAFVRTSEGDIFYGEEMTFTSGESPYTLGDVNGDKQIDISDVVAMVNHILGNTSSTSFKPQAADINKDSNIDISDVVSLVNMILGQ